MNENIHHSNLIRDIVIACKYKTYLEMGLFEGETYFKVLPHVDICVGVDMIDRIKSDKGLLFTMSTDDFFEQNDKTFDAIFIDADHKFESVKKDFNNSLKILNKNGIIFIHDTDPQTSFYIQDGYCGNSYLMVDYIKQNFYDLDIITLPITEAGISIVRRHVDTRVRGFL